MPKKERAYRDALFAEIRRSAYSIVNTLVNTHSSNHSPPRVVAPISLTLSSITTTTLVRMRPMRARSNTRPAGVRLPKMIRCASHLHRGRWENTGSFS